jgi:hypothetical protein
VVWPSYWTYFYSYMNSFGIYCFNELKMVYWTSTHTSCKKEIFWISETIKIENSYSAKMVWPSYQTYFYSYMNSFGIYCFNELKMVYWTSINTSCKKEIFWIRETIKIANSYSAKMVWRSYRTYFYFYMNSFGIYCFNELKMVHWTQ